MAMALDYYEILGVPPKADAGEIKRAYRLLALKWHPDKNPGDPWAAKRFQQVGEAYRVLIDPVRRGAYDWLRSQQSPSRGARPHARRQSGNRTGATPPSPPWRRTRHPPFSTPSRAQRSGGASVSPFSRKDRVRGSGGGLSPWLYSLKDLQTRLLSWLRGRPLEGLEWVLVPTPNQTDLIMDLRLPRWLAARGAKVQFLLRSQHHRRRLRLTIPPGVKDGSCIKVEGGGKNSGGQRGHLYINICLKD